jgi:N-acetyl sugar amidotransferase
MDTTDPLIVFDENGFCNHCTSALEKLKAVSFNTNEERLLALETIVNKIKASGKNNKYDCIIGLSGGVDSSYLAYIVKELGLRPLAVHVDNGWNSELAVKNIENIINKLNIDLHTHVINWEEFKSLQIAFLKASVIDLEMLSDNAIVIGIFNLAKKFKIKYFIDGTNIVSESIMPSSWFYVPKYDSLNIKAIYKRFGSGMTLKTFPLLNLKEYIEYRYFKKGESVALLNYISYHKTEAISILEEKLGWRNYGGKHYESKITHFYQAFILPFKFKVDKRRAHLSSLICSNQITRIEALYELEKELYDPKKFEEDKEYFIKKLNFTLDEFDKIISSPVKQHHDYPSYQLLHKKLGKLVKVFGHKRSTRVK